MKKKLAAILMATLTASTVTACGGNDDVKVIDKTNSEVTENISDESSSSSDTDNSTETVLGGYIFEADGISGTVQLTPDMDMSIVLDKLDDSVSYYEAASCAFQGLDKIYTYNHFEVDTYPDGDIDRISSIILLDDMITTPEGVYIGMTQADMEAAYGSDYEIETGSYVYTKDGCHLSFVISDDSIISIEYSSSVLDQTD